MAASAAAAAAAAEPVEERKDRPSCHGDAVPTNADPDAVMAELAIAKHVNTLETSLYTLFAPRTAPCVILYSLDALYPDGIMGRQSAGRPEDLAVHTVTTTLGQVQLQEHELTTVITPIFLWISHLLRFRTASLAGGGETRVSNILVVFLWTNLLDILRCLNVAECICYTDAVTVRGKPREQIHVLRQHIQSLDEVFASLDTRPLEEHT